jgi:hypothetical protein
VNLRTPDVMSHVQAQVESHYRSELVEKNSSGAQASMPALADILPES